MKNLLRFFTLILILSNFYGCRKEDDNQPQPEYSDQVILATPIITGENVSLTWSKMANQRFVEYMVLRRNYKSSGQITTSSIIAEISDASTTSYIDKNPPYTPYLEYQVIAVLLSNDPQIPENIFSNIVPYERPEIKVFRLGPTDVIPDLDHNRLYVISGDSGKITILNTETLTIEKSITTNAIIGYGDLGELSGSPEIYIPRNDGWVFIYDAETLEKKDQINFGGTASSIIYNGGKLFITGASSSGYYSYNIVAYDRITKNVLSTNTLYDNLRLKLVQNSNTFLFGVPVSSSYYNLSSLEFDSNGQLIEILNHNSNHPLSADIFRVFPAGQLMITGNKGNIFDKDLEYKISLPYGSYEFSDFAINNSETIIYASSGNYKSVISYSYPDCSQIREYQTKGYPKYVFLRDNMLICLSRTTPIDYYPSYYPSDYILEKIPLTK